MDDQNKIISILNDLLKINHDRVDGYEKAADETKPEDSDLRALFQKMENESWEYAEALKALVLKLDGEPAKDTTVSGKIYRVWMDMKAVIAGHDRHTILASCEFGEDAAKHAYDLALSTEVILPAEVRSLIVSQKERLIESHDEIKKLRDMSQV